AGPDRGRALARPPHRGTRPRGHAARGAGGWKLADARAVLAQRLGIETGRLTLRSVYSIWSFAVPSSSLMSRLITIVFTRWVLDEMKSTTRVSESRFRTSSKIGDAPPLARLTASSPESAFSAPAVSTTPATIVPRSPATT